MLERLRVTPGEPARLVERDPRDKMGLEKADAGQRTAALRDRIDDLQYLLHAEATRAVLLVLQGVDASGKDGVIRRVFDGVNPQGVRVVSFKAPVGVELHMTTYGASTLRCRHRERSESSTARTTRTSSRWGARPRSGGGLEAARRAYREFERMLVDEGTAIVKVFLNVSKDEQAERLRERIDDPTKRWKFRAGDLEVSERYDEYLAGSEAAITETSTDWAPWHVVPADRNWVKAYATAAVLCDVLERLDPRLPEGPPA